LHFSGREHNRKTPGEVLLSRGFCELSGLCEVSSRLRLVFLFLGSLFLCWHEVSSVNNFSLEGAQIQNRCPIVVGATMLPQDIEDYYFHCQ
jgi:hypothetical protein